MQQLKSTFLVINSKKVPMENSGFVRNVEFTEIKIRVRTQFKETKKGNF